MAKKARRKAGKRRMKAGRPLTSVKVGGILVGKNQVYNPSTGNIIKRDAETGQFISVKEIGALPNFVKTPNRTTLIKPNPNIDRSTAFKAEEAVLKVKNAMMAKWE